LSPRNISVISETFLKSIKRMLWSDFLWLLSFSLCRSSQRGLCEPLETMQDDLGSLLGKNVYWHLDCGPVKACRWLPCFRGTYCLRVQCRNHWFPSSGLLLPWRWRWFVNLERWLAHKDYIALQRRRHFHWCENLRSHICTDNFLC
jgi:hypothetical protein